MEFLSIRYQAQIEATNHPSREKLSFACISNKLLARSFWIFGHHASHIILKNTGLKTESITTPLTGKPDLGEFRPSSHCYMSLSFQALDLPNETGSPASCYIHFFCLPPQIQKTQCFQDVNQQLCNHPALQKTTKNCFNVP